MIYDYSYMNVMNLISISRLNSPKKRTTTTTPTPISTTTTPEIIDDEDPTTNGTYLPSDGRDGCGRPLSSGFIVGGEIAKTGELPFMALLGYDTNKFYKDGRKKYEYLCGGVLINRYVVIHNDNSKVFGHVEGSY